MIQKKNENVSYDLTEIVDGRSVVYVVPHN